MSDIDKATEAEREVLELVLTEMRHAVSERQQMSMYFDPWTNGEAGAYICVADGYQTEVRGTFRRRKRTGRPRR